MLLVLSTRSLKFSIGQDRMPTALLNAILIVTMRCTPILRQVCYLSLKGCISSSKELKKGDDHFSLYPCSKWVRTQTNMNVNEVVVNWNSLNYPIMYRCIPTMM